VSGLKGFSLLAPLRLHHFLASFQSSWKTLLYLLPFHSFLLHFSTRLASCGRCRYLCSALRHLPQLSHRGCLLGSSARRDLLSSAPPFDSRSDDKLEDHLTTGSSPPICTVWRIGLLNNPSCLDLELGAGAAVQSVDDRDHFPSHSIIARTSLNVCAVRPLRTTFQGDT
jgi:hypothetical protein